MTDPAGPGAWLLRPLRIAAALLTITLAAGCTSGDPSRPPAASPGEIGVGTPATRLADATADPAPATAGDDGVDPSGEPGWSALPPAQLAVTEVAGAGHAGEIWAVGGLDADGRAVTAVQRYTPLSATWARGPDLPQAVHHAALVSTGGTLLLMGGYLGDDFSTPTDAVWVLEEEEVGWRPAAPLPEPRAAGAAAFDGEVVVYGGGVGPEGLAGDVFLGGADGWTSAGVLSQPREHLAAAGADGTVWFMGGRTGGLDSNLGHVDVVRRVGPDGAELTGLGQVLPPAGGVGGFAHPEGLGCMVGGEAPSGTIATVVCVDADGTVRQLPDLQLPRHGLAAATVDDQALVVLGGPEPGLFVTSEGEVLRLGS